MLSMPEKIFYTRDELQKSWQLGESDITQYLMHGSLTAYIWLPMMSIYEVYEQVEGARIVLTKNLRHWEGYTPLYAHQCRTLFKTGEVYLREFMCLEGSKKLTLPETAEGIRITIQDLVVLSEEKKRFEDEHRSATLNNCHLKIVGRIKNTAPVKRYSYFEQGFRKVHHDGIDFRFGAIQASVLQQLYEFALEGDPWQNGKQLLEKAGSQSFTMQNVFKSNSHWRKLIESDERGAYRLQEFFISSIKNP